MTLRWMLSVEGCVGEARATVREESVRVQTSTCGSFSAFSSTSSLVQRRCEGAIDGDAR